MKTNSRFVLIDNTAKKAVVYDGRIVLAVYHFTEEPFTKEDIEWARTDNYATKA